MSTREQIQELGTRMQQSIIGQANVIERLILALLSNGASPHNDNHPSFDGANPWTTCRIHP